MATYQITAPEHFNFNYPDEWPRWIRKFKRFRIASGLSEKAEANQVNMLIYTMGELTEFHRSQRRGQGQVRCGQE